MQKTHFLSALTQFEEGKWLGAWSRDDRHSWYTTSNPNYLVQDFDGPIWILHTLLVNSCDNAY